jgi:hypothetical protein
MEHKKRLEDLNKESLQKFEEWVKAKGLKEEDHASINKAKDEWQVAWNKFMETLMVLERLEI